MWNQCPTLCTLPHVVHLRFYTREKKGEGGGISAKMFHNSEPNPDLFWCDPDPAFHKS